MDQGKGISKAMASNDAAAFSGTEAFFAPAPGALRIAKR
jgi:hypothetical protein